MPPTHPAATRSQARGSSGRHRSHSAQHDWYEFAFLNEAFGGPRAAPLAEAERRDAAGAAREEAAALGGSSV